MNKQEFCAAQFTFRNEAVNRSYLIGIFLIILFFFSKISMATPTQASFLPCKIFSYSLEWTLFWILHVISNLTSHLSWSCVIKTSCLHCAFICCSKHCFSTARCYILENDTVQCDTDLYRSLQAWKDHKLHIDHEVSDAVGHAFSVCDFSLVCGLIGSCCVSVCLWVSLSIPGTFWT